MKVVGYVTSTIVLMVYGALMNGWALSKLWSWFIAMTFEVREISIPQAIGLAVVVGYLTQRISTKKDEREWWEQLLESAVVSTLKPLTAVGFGWVVKLWL